MESADKDAFVLIEELKKRIKALEDSMGERNRQRAFDRRNIAELKQYINPKGRTRNDFDILANQLMDKVINRTKGMDYKAVMNTFKLSSADGAYRLMDKTVEKFPQYVKIKHILSSNRKKRLIVRVGAST
jgi:hypothetical protein